MYQSVASEIFDQIKPIQVDGAAAGCAASRAEKARTDNAAATAPTEKTELFEAAATLKKKNASLEEGDKQHIEDGMA